MKGISRLFEREESEPIVTSPMDTDFYKFTMAQMIIHRYRDINVTFSFINRNRNVPLADIIPESELRHQLDQARKISFNNSDLHYLRGTNEYGERMFHEDFLQDLKRFELPPYELERVGDQYRFEVSGPWYQATHWEIHALEIFNELYFWSLMCKLSSFERDAVYAEGIRRLHEKVKVLKAHPEVVFSDFGTRRRFSQKWQNYVDSVLASELSPTQFRGTSDVELAMHYGLLPMGTSAHELPMVVAAANFSKIAALTTQDLVNAQNEVLSCWHNEFGYGLSIFLTDTFGTDFAFRTASDFTAQKWRGLRHDSGDPFDFGEKAIRWYESHGENPKNKLVIFSDQMYLELMIDLAARFKERIGVAFGWGTNLTNDLGFDTLSLVVKASRANGRSTVKLSDNLAKAMGDPTEVDLYKRLAGYANTDSVECRS